MPVLGLLLTSAFSGLVGWFAQFLTRKVAFAAAVVSAYSVITVALFAVMRATLSGLSALLTGMPAAFVTGMSYAIPPVAVPCITAYVTMWTACTVWTWQRDLLKLAASV